MMEDDDDYFFYGTSLPEDDETLKKIATRELQVRDEKGRQRLHGAFTGGFSAGYFNTVGTKEGWAPSSFISSRRKKTAEYKKQQPEDFMDDEDFGEFGIASRKIHMTSSFQDESSAPPRKRVCYINDSVIPGEAPLKDLIRPVKESIGIQILKKLGWKQGQGIGPRIKKSSNRYGCSQFPGDENVKEEDEFMLKYTFAPEDIIGPSYEIKDNYFGLGYIGLSKQSVLNTPVDLFSPTSTKSWLAKDKKKLSITGQAFGVGAFEDEDEDIYSKDDMSQYDFSEFSLTDKEEICDNRGSQKSKASANDIIKGFHAANQPLAPKKHYLPPPLPKNFKPVHLSLNKPLFEKKSRQLTAHERSSLLGETKFSLSEPSSEKQKDWKEKLKLSISFNQSSTQFRPFAHDSEKQKRYEQFIKLVELGETEKLIQPSSMTEWEKFQEIEEFSKVVNFFRPAASCISNRFVSKSHLNLEQEIQEALQNKKEEMKKKINKRLALGSTNRHSKEWHPVSLLCKRFNVPNPYPNTNANNDSHSQKIKKKFHFADFFESAAQTSNHNSNSFEDEIARPLKNEKKDDLFEEKSTSYNDLSSATESSSFENKRPPLDLFKEIFGNSSSEDEEETDIKNENDNESSSNTLSVMDKINVQSRNSSNISEQTFNNKNKGFGVFANLDLDVLKQDHLNQIANKKSNQQTINELSDSDNDNSSIAILAEKSHTGSIVYNPKLSSNYSKLDAQKEINPRGLNQDIKRESQKQIVKELNLSNSNTEILNEDSDDTSEFYGPHLPPDYTASNSSSGTTTIYSKDKSSHKHKHHKHKKSKKKKKHKKDLEKLALNINPLSIIEKLKKFQ